MDLLRKHAAALGLPLSEGQLAAFEVYRVELLDWNRRVNLTAVTDPSEVELRHFADSLTCFIGLDAMLRQRPTARVIDVGSGAGFPGLPLKLARPDMRLTLLDSVGKKTAFLDHMVARLGLQDVEVVTVRAEDLARSAQHRDGYDAAVSRAVAALPVLLELCLPFLRPGGRLVAIRRGDLAQQQAKAARAVHELAASFQRPLPGLRGSGLVVVGKVGPTPQRYPRRSGIPAKRPL